jgi:hypothetical protein
MMPPTRLSPAIFAVEKGCGDFDGITWSGGKAPTKYRRAVFLSDYFLMGVLGFNGHSGVPFRNFLPRGWFAGALVDSRCCLLAWRCREARAARLYPAVEK